MKGIPTYSQMRLLTSGDPINPSRAQSLFLGLIAGPFNWPMLLMVYLIRPIGTWIWEGICMLIGGISALAIATGLLIVVFPICGVLGRIGIVPEEPKAG